jgi:hypothetical protein
VEHTQEFGTVLHVGGADLMDGTPIFDIKPYIPYGDCHPDATGGFTDTAGEFLLQVDFPTPLLEILPQEKREAVLFKKQRKTLLTAIRQKKKVFLQLAISRKCRIFSAN